MGRKNLYAAWVGILLGILAGAIQGMFFHGEDWLGGYTSWARRMTRLGHISFFGLAFINLAFALTVSAVRPVKGVALPSWLFIIGAATMPLFCYLSAFNQAWRHGFAVPVACVLVGTVVFVFRGLFR